LEVGAAIGETAAPRRSRRIGALGRVWTLPRRRFPSVSPGWHHQPPPRGV